MELKDVVGIQSQKREIRILSGAHDVRLGSVVGLTEPTPTRGLVWAGDHLSIFRSGYPLIAAESAQHAVFTVVDVNRCGILVLGFEEAVDEIGGQSSDKRARLVAGAICKQKGGPVGAFLLPN